MGKTLEMFFLRFLWISFEDGPKKNPTKSVVNRWEKVRIFSKVPAPSSLKLVFFFLNASHGQCGDELTYLRAVIFFSNKRVEEPNHQQQKLMLIK